ncbi:hypothetical protein O1611_g7446 [Lasiodiplodia mahajangana]|uniref:Uncharacterized protein n=1 Tax=Lasiodiplodia mahajangana TaxID=1108764 RepID=A0ACC2JFV4_9PEZI|nr:hypothetical protein O1611_g7446 [Lasiodiplodia mahajangana]
MQHHPHSQGPTAPQHLPQHSRPSIVHQQHHQAPSGQSQHASAYSSHSIQPYQASSHSTNAQHTQDLPYYAHQSPYSTPGTTSGYTSADTSDMMAAAQMPRPYPPIYHTPQSNSPASVASPSAHEHRTTIFLDAATSAIAISATCAAAPSVNGVATHCSGLARARWGTPQPNQNGGQLSTPTGSSTPGINNNAAPGPIPATTPLVVRQDNNGVQWIAFEYSRDRVKMEYTIRCDVESVNTDELGGDFRTENCVYPRACCSKDQYRGNRLQYETECNTVGWALAQLNPCLRGKRGLIQRAVDSWRNSNQDPRLRSRRVRRMAKMNNRKTAQPPHSTHIPGPSGPTGMAAPGAIGPSSAAPLGKPGMTSMSSQMHHHHAHEGSAPGGGDEVGDGEYMDESHHHHHQAPGGPGSGSAEDVRSSHVFAGYPQQYPSHATSGSSAPPMHDGLGGSHHGPIAAKRHSREDEDTAPEGLFPNITGTKKPVFIVVEGDTRSGGTRQRVRVNLQQVDVKEIPDSFRKRSAVFPRSYFPLEMQDPPPSATGSRFFEDDLSDEDVEVDGGRTGRSRTSRARDTVTVKVPLGNGVEGEAAIPRTRNSGRIKEVRLNELGYRLAWRNSRPFAGRTVFLQRALDSYRNKTRSSVESVAADITKVAPHFETRVGKRRWTERMGAVEKPADGDA